MATPNKAPKTMSSRLATMKFMQRASASPASSPTTPSEPPSKKQRMSNGAAASSPISTPGSEALAVEEALAAEEQKRIDAMEREGADRGESRWYLSFKEPPTQLKEPALRIVSAGYSTLDSGRGEKEDEQNARPSIAGRRSFGKFNRGVEKQQNPNLSSSDSDSDDSDEDSDDSEDGSDDDDPTGAKALIRATRKEAGDKARAERKAKKNAEKAEALRLAEERRKKKVKLNDLTSISGSTGPGSNQHKNVTCHRCGEKGHMIKDCPKQQQRSKKW